MVKLNVIITSEGKINYEHRKKNIVIFKPNKIWLDP